MKVSELYTFYNSISTKPIIYSSTIIYIYTNLKKERKVPQHLCALAALFGKGPWTMLSSAQFLVRHCKHPTPKEDVKVSNTPIRYKEKEVYMKIKSSKLDFCSHSNKRIKKLIKETMNHNVIQP